MTRLALAAALAAPLLLTSCSSDDDEAGSPNVDRFRAGNAVVVLVADVKPGYTPDIGAMGRWPGVISVGGDTDTLKMSFGRQALLADVAAARLDLAKIPELSHVREVFVEP